MRVIVSPTRHGSALATAAAHSNPVRSEVLGERFEGMMHVRASGGPTHAAACNSLLGTVAAALHEGDLLGALSSCYGQALPSHPMQTLLIRRAETSGAFLVDRSHRRRALGLLCRQAFGARGLLVVHPPALEWHPAGAEAPLRPRRRQDLLLCVLLGELGFAQLCDDRLDHAVPLLIQPWCAERGLLRPVQLPAQSFSQSLCVRRLGGRRLLLFDKRCVPTAGIGSVLRGDGPCSAT